MAVGRRAFFTSGRHQTLDKLTQKTGFTMLFSTLSGLDVCRIIIQGLYYLL